MEWWNEWQQLVHKEAVDIRDRNAVVETCVESGARVDRRREI